MQREEVFDFANRRREQSTMSARAYLGMLTLLVCGGLAASVLCAKVTYDIRPDKIWALAFFAGMLAGVVASAMSSSWFVSLIGYGLVVISGGGMLGPVVAEYQLNSVAQIAALTIAISTAVGIAGVLYPKSVQHWTGILLAGFLLVTLGDFVRIGMLAFGIPVGFTVVDYVAAAVFTAAIFYEMNRAMRLPRTMDNAVDSAVALYLDIINLFLRLLRILGKKS